MIADRQGEGAVGAMTPQLYRVLGRRRDTEDVATITLAPVSGPNLRFEAGQFTMLSVLGTGEAPISVSCSPEEQGPLRQTVRDVGPVTHALCGVETGDLVGVRGPFGTTWPIDQLCVPGADAVDVVVVAGGIGLAPLRGAVEQLVAARADTDKIIVLVGAREPDQIVFAEDLRAWEEAGAQVAVTVDVASSEWGGHVGLVTSLLDGARFDPPSTTALLCGPEIMMRFTARALEDRGVDPARIWVSLERNMQCAVAWCGHCQLGPYLLCRDGPILPYAETLAHLLGERER